MILFIALAGALGTGTLGIKVYREEKKKKEYPWTYAALWMALRTLAVRRKGGRRPLVLPFRSKKKPSLLLDGVSRRLDEGMLSTKASLTRVKEQLVKPFGSSLEAQRRSLHQQLDAVSKEDEEARKRAAGISPEEQQINRYMASGAMALGLSLGGYFIPLLAAIPAFYSFLPVYLSESGEALIQRASHRYGYVRHA